MKTAFGLGAVGLVMGAGLLALSALEKRNERDYTKKIQILERRARNITQSPRAEGERISLHIGESTGKLVSWKEKSWVERAIMPPPNVSNEAPPRPEVVPVVIEMVELPPATNEEEEGEDTPVVSDVQQAPSSTSRELFPLNRLEGEVAATIVDKISESD